MEIKTKCTLFSNESIEIFENYYFLNTTWEGLRWKPKSEREKKLLYSKVPFNDLSS